MSQFSKSLVSGATLSTVASGRSFLYAVYPMTLSGGAVSYSGSVIRVNDATSGMAAQASGMALYEWQFGIHSGLLQGGLSIASNPWPVTLKALCLSGIVVQGAAGWRILVTYFQPPPL